MFQDTSSSLPPQKYPALLTHRLSRHKNTPHSCLIVSPAITIPRALLLPRSSFIVAADRRPPTTSADHDGRRIVCPKASVWQHQCSDREFGTRALGTFAPALRTFGVLRGHGCYNFTMLLIFAILSLMIHPSIINRASSIARRPQAQDYDTPAASRVTIAIAFVVVRHFTRIWGRMP